ncbi:calcium-binding protein [Neisseria sp.]|uniref:calcium-binding protein n=1 Tax=Neisseria sp. TaxID=192066 RepID=UPI0035A03643
MSGINENQKSLKVSEITVDRILSHYLWNSSTPPKREHMAASKTDAARTPVRIDAVDYMQNGAGRYASAANFALFENFFKKKLPVRDRPYTFDEIGNIIYKEEFIDLKDNFYKTNPKKDKGFTVSVSQYFTGVNTRDYVERAFIFGSTQVTVTPEDLKKLQFIVKPDGSKEIRNLRITPVKDNFDFEGGPSNTDRIEDRVKKQMVDTANAAFKITLDPKGIGKTVPMEYADTGRLKFVNVTDKEFKNLLAAKSEQEISAEKGLPLLGNSGILANRLIHSPSLYTNEYINDLKKYFNDVGKMYNKTRELIDKDPGRNMSENRQQESNPDGQQNQSQYVQAAPALRLEDMPEKAQELSPYSLSPQAEAIMVNGKECFTKFCDYYNIRYPQDKLDNIAAAMAAYGRFENMRSVSKIDVDGDNVLIGHQQPDLVTAEFSLQKAVDTPIEESMRQLQIAENKLLQEERQRQLEREQGEKSHSIGMS